MKLRIVIYIHNICFLFSLNLFIVNYKKEILQIPKMHTVFWIYSKL